MNWDDALLQWSYIKSLMKPTGAMYPNEHVPWGPYSINLRYAGYWPERIILKAWYSKPLISTEETNMYCPNSPYGCKCAIMCGLKQWGKDCFPWDCDFVWDFKDGNYDGPNPCPVRYPAIMSIMCTQHVSVFAYGPFNFLLFGGDVYPYQPVTWTPNFYKVNWSWANESGCPYWIWLRDIEILDFGLINIPVDPQRPHDILDLPKTRPEAVIEDIEIKVLPTGAIYVRGTTPYIQYADAVMPSFVLKWKNRYNLIGKLYWRKSFNARTRFEFEYLYSPI